MQAPKKKALCIGVAYTRDSVEYHLGGAHNDALRVAAVLEEDYNYRARILLDKEPYTYPTRENIKAAIAELVQDAQPGDCLFFHFSGHGDQIPNLNGEEEDGKDELILPCDWKMDPNHMSFDDRDRYFEDGRILDDELHNWLVLTIPVGCYLNALFDNCHSGTALDLKYRRYCRSPERNYTDSPMASVIYEEPTSIGSPTERQQPVSRIGSESRSRQNSLGIQNAMEIGYAVERPGGSTRKFSTPRGRLIVRGESRDPKSVHMLGGFVFSWCACSDEQNAGESTVSGKASGYMVDAFLNCLKKNPRPTYEQMLLALNVQLQNICHKYNSQNGRRPSVHQDPELGSHLMPDMNATIVI